MFMHLLIVFKRNLIGSRGMRRLRRLLNGLSRYEVMKSIILPEVCSHYFTAVNVSKTLRLKMNRTVVFRRDECRYNSLQSLIMRNRSSVMERWEKADFRRKESLKMGVGDQNCIATARLACGATANLLPRASGSICHAGKLLC